MSSEADWVERCLSVESAREEALADKGVIESHFKIRSTNHVAEMFRQCVSSGAIKEEFLESIADEVVSRHEDWMAKQAPPGVPSRLTSLERRALRGFLLRVLTEDVATRCADREEVFRYVYRQALAEDDSSGG